MAEKSRERLILEAKARARELELGGFEQPQISPEAQALRNETPEQRSERRQREQAEAKQEAFNEMSKTNQFLAGAGKVAYMTGPGLVKRLWGNKEAEELGAEYEIASQASPMAMLGEFGGDVALTAVPASKAAKLVKFAKPKYIQAMAKGAAAAVPSIGIHQGQNIAETGKVDPVGGTIEGVASTLLPGGGSLVKYAGKNLGGKIVETAAKASRKINGQKVMNPKQIGEFFRKYSSWRGIKGSVEKLSGHEDELGGMFDELMDGLAAGTKVDFHTAIGNARNRVNKLMADGKINMDSYESMLKKLKDFDVMVEPLTDKDGMVKGHIAQRFKKNTLDKIANYDKPNPLTTFDPKLSGKASAARVTRQELSKQLEYLNPDFKEVNLAYKKMAEIRPFIEQTAERMAANRGLSLQDLTTGSLGLAGIWGSTTEHPYSKYAGLAALPFLASRAQKSLPLAHMLERAGGLAQKGLSNQAIGQTGRTALDQTMENPYLQRTVPGLAGM